MKHTVVHYPEDVQAWSHRWQGFYCFGVLGKWRTQCYASNLGQMNEAIKLKRRGNLTEIVLLLQVNAPLPIALVAVAEAANCTFEWLQHPLTHLT